MTAVYKKKSAKKKKPTLDQEMQKALARTRKLVELMLGVMEEGVKHPEEIPESWDRVFGVRSSAVANLQKLVEVLIDIRDEMAVEQMAQHAGGEDWTKEEMKLLTEWLSQGGS